MQKPLPELFLDVIERHFHMEVMGSNWQDDLRRELNNSNFPNRAEQFQKQFAEAILYQTITPEQYSELTEQEFETPEDLEAELRELWHAFYGDKPVAVKVD
ncbi:hypothetical protein [Anthocerotibacter panamensis]|uniref:hypothetical protein n=1 Tax=Anthocerotibacter panamensis TaxID=2857077 RepID=UPI001C401AB9|nr:hypothetical protein [Anthocerotibacter panamensis]